MKDERAPLPEGWSVASDVTFTDADVADANAKAADALRMTEYEAAWRRADQAAQARARLPGEEVTEPAGDPVPEGERAALIAGSRFRFPLCVECHRVIPDERRRGRPRVKTCSVLCGSSLKINTETIDRWHARSAERKPRGPCASCGAEIPPERNGRARTCSERCGKAFRQLQARNRQQRARKRKTGTAGGTRIPASMLPLRRPEG